MGCGQVRPLCAGPARAKRRARTPLSSPQRRCNLLDCVALYHTSMRPANGCAHRIWRAQCWCAPHFGRRRGRGERGSMYVVFVAGTLALTAFIGYNTFATAMLMRRWRLTSNPLLSRADAFVRLMLIGVCIGLGAISGLDYR